MFRQVVIITGTQGATRRYRCDHLAEQLALLGIPSYTRHVADFAPAKLRRGDDLLVLHRVSYDRFVSDLIQICHAAGGTVVYDIDDLLFDPAILPWIDNPSLADSLGRTLASTQMTKLAQAMAACDAVIVSTHALAAYAATIGKPVWVHQNAFSRQMLVLAQDALEHRRKSSDRVTIVYASGTPTHNSDFQVVRRALTHVLKSHPHVELLVIGDVDVGAGWASAGRRIRRLPPVHWTNLPRLLARADINIVPLETTNPFCRAKSEVKYIEASLVEIPTIASRIDSYATAIKHGDTGLLADDEGDWIEALETLVNDEACRHALGIRAKNDVISRYSPQVRAQHLRELLCAVQSLRRTNDGQVLRCSLNTDWVRPPVQPDDFTTLERRLHLVKRTLYSLRYKGLSVLLLEMWVFAARWLRVAAWRRKGTR